jgi:hypothetical protein
MRAVSEGYTHMVQLTIGEGSSGERRSMRERARILGEDKMNDLLDNHE